MKKLQRGIVMLTTGAMLAGSLTGCGVSAKSKDYFVKTGS